MQNKLTINEINKIIACLRCKRPIFLLKAHDAICHNCGETYCLIPGTWKLIPSVYRSSSELWPIWDQLQANSLVGYNHEPEHNLSVGERLDCLDFGLFCRFDGLVLDVGCGPHLWPAYFKFRSDLTKFVGVDPLIQESNSEYIQFQALGEYLPFHDRVFDYVVFATCLDHFINPARALIEARRVCRLSGEIDIWIGEKRLDVSKLTVSPKWYLGLKKPDEAEDLFHLKRLQSTELKAVFNHVDLNIIQERVQKVDEFRSNYFYRLRGGQADVTG